MSPEVGTAALAKVADGFAKELFQSAKGAVAKSLGKFQAEFGVGFEKYVQRNQSKCRYVKTLLHRIDPIPIEQAYVEPSLKVRKEVIQGNSFPEKLDQLKNVVIVGNGGSGKSMFLKKLFLELCEYPLGRIPLFVELRDLNSRDDKDVLKLVHHHWSELIPSFSFEALESGFRSGKFFLLLDGLDEVDRQARDAVSKSIIAISYKFPRCPVALTSRPISDFSAWQEFYTAEIQPFDLSRITALVDKAKIDDVVKKKFLDEVSGRLYRSHEAFLENPLLCTMMVLTYTEFEEIPSKMHIFYARAFDVLFTRHDKTKTFFNRKFYTTLAEDDFKKLFSTFCLFSYLEDNFSFDRDRAVRLLEQVFEFENSSTLPNDFLLDMHESISILVKDGDTYSFLHRSFQEYFAAVFLAERQVPKMDQLFDRVLQKGRGDNVLNLLFEMNRDALEAKYLIRKVRKFRSDLEKLDPKKDLAKLLSLMAIREIRVKPREIYWVHNSYSFLLDFVSRIYHFDVVLEDRELLIPHQWLAMHGEREWLVIEGLKEKSARTFMTSSIPNEAVAAWPEVADKLAKLRSEVIQLDELFKSKGARRDSFVANLLKKKNEG